MNEIQPSDIKSLKIDYISHFVLLAIIIIFNFLLLNKIIWLNNVIYYLYLSGSLIGIIYFLFPVVPLIFILSKKLKIKKIPTIRLITLIFCIISLILGLFSSVVLMMNTIESNDFCKDCPFNIPISNISNKDQCKNKICILNNEDLDKNFPYEYLCNYMPTKFFTDAEGPFKRKVNDSYEITSEFQIFCEKYEFNEYNFKNELIYKYLNICKDLDEFYICQRFFEHKKYSIDENFECPNEDYANTLIILSILNLFANLPVCFIPWRIEITTYDKIIDRISSTNNNERNKSKNSTKNSSKIINDNNNEGIFNKAPTEIIIVCNSKDINLNNGINNNTNNNNINNNIDNNNNVKEKEIIINTIKFKKEPKIQDYENQNNNNILTSSDTFILNSNKSIKNMKHK